MKKFILLTTALIAFSSSGTYAQKKHISKEMTLVFLMSVVLKQQKTVRFLSIGQELIFRHNFQVESYVSRCRTPEAITIMCLLTISYIK